MMKYEQKIKIKIKYSSPFSVSPYNQISQLNES